MNSKVQTPEEAIRVVGYLRIGATDGGELPSCVLRAEQGSSGQQCVTTEPL